MPKVCLKNFQFKKSTSGYLAHEFVLYFEWVYDYELNYFFQPLQFVHPTE
jgi:hypothetical protein